MEEILAPDIGGGANRGEGWRGGAGLSYGRCGGADEVAGRRRRLAAENRHGKADCGTTSAGREADDGG